MPSADHDHADDDALPVFGFVACHGEPLADGVAKEPGWMAHSAATGRAAAHLWQGVPGFVVPRAYERAPHWHSACTEAAAWGWPVQVRGSGGGLVPQGPGVLNLSLVWPAPAGAGPGPRFEPVYRALCGRLAAALARVGVSAAPSAVPGSFCDGRYNLAVRGAKLAGTAQCWRRVAGVPLVLAHAVLLVDADTTALTQRCNQLEAALGHPQRYRAEAVTSVAQALQQPAADLPTRVQQAVAQQFARVLPPAPAQETATWS